MMRKLVSGMIFLIVIGLSFCAFSEEYCRLNGTEFHRLTEYIELDSKDAPPIRTFMNELKQFPNLRYLSWRQPVLSVKHISQLMETFPQISFFLTFKWFGEEYSTDMTYASISTSRMRDGDLRNFIAVMPYLEKLDIFSHRATITKLKNLFEDFPAISFGCTIPIGTRFVRNDATAFSTLGSRKSESFNSKHFDRLKYCPDLLALDLGHNNIKDLSFLQYFPHLKVLILADNNINDLSDLASYVPELEYLEIFMNRITDISPLTGLKHLRHLNITHNRVEDLSPILQMPQLIRCWAAYNKYPKEQVQMLKEAMPDTHFEFDSYLSTGAGWREPSPYYDAIWDMFHTYIYNPLPD